MRLVLFSPDIAGNLGAVMRLTACFGLPCELIEPCGFPLTAKALRRAAMDYGAPEQVIRHRDLTSFADSLSGARLVLMSTKAACPLEQFSFRPDDVLVFGRESAGAPPELHAMAGARVIIPMAPGARSLNLASCASITVFEALRQTGGLAQGSLSVKAEI